MSDEYDYYLLGLPGMGGAQGYRRFPKGHVVDKERLWNTEDWGQSKDYPYSEGGRYFMCSKLSDESVAAFPYLPPFGYTDKEQE